MSVNYTFKGAIYTRRANSVEQCGSLCQDYLSQKDVIFSLKEIRDLMQMRTEGQGKAFEIHKCYLLLSGPLCA